MELPIPETITISAGENEWLMLGPHVRGRSCGSCQACCVQVPVVLSATEHKGANVRCRHLRAKGCGIYANRPRACIAWSCRWLFDAETAELRRPDLSGVVIDSQPDMVLADGQSVQVVQLWVDPKRRDAHRDPALRRYLERLTERHQMLVIVRYDAEDGLVLLPPWANTSGEWVEHKSATNSAAVNRAKLESRDPLLVLQVAADARAQAAKR